MNTFKQNMERSKRLDSQLEKHGLYRFDDAVFDTTLPRNYPAFVGHVDVLELTEPFNILDIKVISEYLDNGRKLSCAKYEQEQREAREWSERGEYHAL